VGDRIVGCPALLDCIFAFVAASLALVSCVHAAMLCAPMHRLQDRLRAVIGPGTWWV
jgi:hypothetical protein